MRWLRGTLVAAVVLVLVGAFVRVPWQARGHVTRAVYLLDLGIAPLWSPPPAPTRERFAKTFHESELAAQEAAPGFWIEVGVWWEAWLTWTVLAVAVPCLAWGRWYWASRGTRLDATLHAAHDAGLGVVGAVVASIALWLVLGGWGPPFPLPLAALGLIGGGLCGLRRYRRLARRPLPSARRSATIRR